MSRPTTSHVTEALREQRGTLPRTPGQGRPSWDDALKVLDEQGTENNQGQDVSGPVRLDLRFDPGHPATHGEPVEPQGPEGQDGPPSDEHARPAIAENASTPAPARGARGVSWSTVAHGRVSSRWGLRKNPRGARRREVAPAHAERRTASRQYEERLHLELRLAQRVQQSMLPRSMPEVDRTRFGARMCPAGYLAGDFYGVFRLDQEHVAACVVDVMGHGPAAALLGVYVLQSMRTKRIEGHSYSIIDPAEVLETLNRDLIAADFPDSPFVTMVYGVLNVKSLVWNYCAAGHPAAALLRPGHSPALLHGKDPILGVIDTPFTSESVTLKRGDRLLFFSDGVDEVPWQSNRRGVGGLIERLSVRDGRTPQELIDSAIHDCVRDHEDDITILMAQIDE